MDGPLRIFSDKTVEDPYPAYRWLRENDPVYFDPATGDWHLTRYEDVYDALRNHAVFSSSAMGGAGGVGFPLISDDPPRHTRLRSLVNRAFTSSVIKRLEPFIEATCNDLIERFPKGPLDVVHGLTVPFPVIVISRMMGIPEKDRERFKLWSDALTGLLDGATRAGQAEVIMEMFPYFAREIEKRRSEPMDDLIAAVANAKGEEDEQLSDQEIIGFCLLLLVAGNETTTNLVGNMINVLLDQPALWERLRSDRSLTETAVEETLRYDSPVQFIYRRLMCDVALHGKALKSGQRVIVGFASANRDPENFDRPDEFSLDRELKRHLAFGHGIHFCLGAPLARVEGRIALDALLDRFSAATRAGQGVRLPSHLLRGFSKLPVTFT